MARHHGITSTTYTNLIYDTGAVYTGFTDFSSLGTLLGATSGGSTLSIEQEVKVIQADGALGPVKGGRRIISTMAKLTVNFLEHSLANFKRAMPASTSATFDVSWDAVTRAVRIADTDYIDDITLVAESSGGANSFGVKLSNVLCDGNIEMTFGDKEEAILPITFTAHYTTSDLDTDPVTIYYPNAQS